MDLIALQRTMGPGLAKVPTGIEGFDEITLGGLPRGRPTLVCGSAGCGKTLFAIEFIVHGATEFGEPGVFVAFEETAKDLTENVASLGFDLDDLQKRNLVRIDHVRIDRSEIEESGEYDLEGLFIRLGYLISQIGAKRVVLDTIETIFSGLSNTTILRNEIQRLFHWLKDQGISAVITGERGDGQLTRQGLEEYVSDCVILLDHRVNEQVSTRRLRIVKYRGTLHGTNEYPFLIDQDGITLLPITTLGLQHTVSRERVSTGVQDLDQMLGGAGLYRGSSVLLSGTSGTGKSSLAASFAAATCARGEKCIYFAFEESPAQIIRNMKSIHLDLQPWMDKGLLIIQASRPVHSGLETHLATMLNQVDKLKPSAVVIDPISDFGSAGDRRDITAMLVRLVDYLKAKGVTAMFVNLTAGANFQEQTEVHMSSLMDTWILLRDIELDGERNRVVYVLKSRGMNHSNQIREFVITDQGIHLLDVYVGPSGVLTGSARIVQEALERRQSDVATEEGERRKSLAHRKKQALEAQIAAIQAEIDAEESEISAVASQEARRMEMDTEERSQMRKRRDGPKMSLDGEPGAPE